MEVLMTMLPSPTEPHFMTHPVIAVICPSPARFAQFASLLTSCANSSRTLPCLTENSVHLVELNSDIALVVLAPDERHAHMLSAVDGMIAILDGDRGLDKATQALWDAASDLDLPRLVVAPDANITRADFDEVVAIVQRVLEPDALIRYLPINDEDSSDYVGLFDLLTNDIRAYSVDGIVSHIAPEHEHLELTTDQRETFVDELAHVVLDDEALENFAQGLPLNMARLRESWNGNDIVTVLPLTERVGADLIVEWLTNRHQRVYPIVQSNVTGESTTPLADVTYGYAIDEKVIRLWGPAVDVTSLVSVETGTVVDLVGSVSGVALVDGRVKTESSFVSDVAAANGTYLLLPELL